MQAGKPISTCAEDAFERLTFAQHLAGCLCLPEGAPSIVVGVEGEWGLGKTSCINLVREIIQKDVSRPIIVEYSPWLISTLDSVIEGFFVQLAASIGAQSRADNARDAARKVLQFGKLLAPIKLIPGVEPWGSMVETVLSAVGDSANAGAELANLDLQARRDDLQRRFAKLKRPIVVIIDDIDRLPPEQVRIVFQMLKAVCDFDRVSYLVAYDPEPVRKALSYGDTYDGARYLEKIVQISYHLPRLAYVHMRAFLATNIARTLAETGVELTAVEEEVWEVALDQSDLVRVFTTPRDIVRVCNRVRFAAASTQGEVCFADLVCFELIHVKLPALTTLIRQQPERFIMALGRDVELSSDSFISAWLTSEREDDKKTLLDGVLDELSYNPRERDQAKSLLVFLFPDMGGEGGVRYEVPELPTRIQHRDSLLKLLQSGVISFTYSVKTAERFYSSGSERPQIVADYREGGDLAGWISSAMASAGQYKLDDPVGLCRLLAEEGGKASVEPSSFSLAQHLGEFLYRVIEGEDDASKRRGMLEWLVRNEESLAVSHTVLLHFAGTYGIWREGAFYDNLEEKRKIPPERRTVTYEFLYGVIAVWLDTVRRVASGPGIVGQQSDALDILFRWAQFNGNDYSEVQAHVAKHVDDREWVEQFLLLFDPSTNGNNLYPLISDVPAFVALIRLEFPDNERFEQMAKLLEGMKQNEDNKNGGVVGTEEGEGQRNERERAGRVSDVTEGA